MQEAGVLGTEYRSGAGGSETPGLGRPSLPS